MLVRALFLDLMHRIAGKMATCAILRLIFRFDENKSQKDGILMLAVGLFLYSMGGIAGNTAI